MYTMAPHGVDMTSFHTCQAMLDCCSKATVGGLCVAILLDYSIDDNGSSDRSPYRSEFTKSGPYFSHSLTHVPLITILRSNFQHISQLSCFISSQRFATLERCLVLKAPGTGRAKPFHVFAELDAASVSASK